MHEKKFSLIEGETFTIDQLGKEIEEIVGSKLVDLTGVKRRVVAQKPSPEQGFETFTIKFDLEDLPDFVDVVATTEKKENIEEYDFNKEEFKVRLVSYIRQEAPKGNESGHVSE
ncbi:hypothetical protein [Lacicoccus alkaliphilus]|uniref:Uncharacterized protein n=1 Tax=Lacicoccus alkaliphilus DSM 16010 TaxID=1123231 RepID=A0A1M7F3E8_9BACL|nr:hypothetical protein [Salinicoccus alkaliphilus]SHL98187.1 hypothetical protein SAMN02745189_01310 [Salinicoccus alkaliphilus DSM 16010]